MEDKICDPVYEKMIIVLIFFHPHDIILDVVKAVVFDFIDNICMITRVLMDVALETINNFTFHNLYSFVGDLGIKCSNSTLHCFYVLLLLLRVEIPFVFVFCGKIWQIKYMLAGIQFIHALLF